MRRGWLLLLAGALVLRLLFFAGVLGWDDAEYGDAARRLRAGEPPRAIFDLRWGVVLPLAAVQAVLGEGEVAAALVPLVWSVAEVGLAAALGCRLGGPAVGSLAALLVAVLPVAVVAATDVHADLPASVLMAAAMYAALRGEGDGPAARRWSSLAGLALGAACLTKEVALALLLPLVLRWLGARTARTGAGWLAAGLVAMIAVDALVSLVRTGDPFFRHSATVAAPHLAHMASSPPGHAWMIEYPAMLLLPWSGHFGAFAGIGWPALAGAVMGLARGEPAARAAVLWWAPLFLVFNFAPLDPTFQHPLFFHFPRTLHPLLVPLALGTAVFVARDLAGRPWLRGLVVVVGGTLVAAGIWVTHFDHRAWSAVARQAVPLLAREPATTRLLADLKTAQQLRVLLPARRARILWYAEHDVPGPAAEPALVLRDPRYLADDLAHGRRVPEAVVTPPATWERLAELSRPTRPHLRALGARSAEAPAVLWRVRP